MVGSLALALALMAPAEDQVPAAPAEGSTPDVSADASDESADSDEAESADEPAAEAAAATPEPEPEPAVEAEPEAEAEAEAEAGDAGPYAAGFNAQFRAGIGVGRRRIGPVARAGTGGVVYPQATPVAEVAFRVGIVPERARALEVFGGGSLRTAFASRISVTSETGTPRRPRARSMQGLVSLGLLGWPKALNHKFAIGGELAYAFYPFLVESKIGVPSFLLHGPLVALRLQGELGDERVLLGLRPFVGAAITDGRLRAARYGGGSVQWGVSAQVAVRIYGFLHAYVNYSERHAPLPYGNGGAIDDLERAGVLGLMIRGTRDPKKRN